MPVAQRFRHALFTAALVIAPVTAAFADTQQALKLFDQQRYAAARPALEQALISTPDNISLRHALAAVQFDAGDIEAAWNTLQAALDNADFDVALLASQIRVAASDYQNAHKWLQKASSLAENRNERNRARLTLAHVLAHEGKQAELLTLARDAADGDQLTSQYLNRLGSQLGDQKGALRIELGYRFEHDSNVAALPDNVFVLNAPSDESDNRHVMFADVVGQHKLNNNLRLFGEAHINAGWHQDLDQFDYRTINLLGGAGWNNADFGLRLPFEYQHQSIDGNTVKQVWSAAPGIVMQPSKQSQIFVFFRHEQRNYDNATTQAEDRSGSANILGTNLRWTSSDRRSALRAIVQYGDERADGDNWGREAWRIYLRADHKPHKKLQIAVGAELLDYDFDNVHNVFFVARDDQRRSIFLAASYEFAPQWHANFSAIWLDNESNIALYDHDRQVFSAGVSWRY